MFGLPASVLIGLFTGIPIAFFVLFEMSPSSPVTQFLFSSRAKVVVLSTMVSICAGMLTGPVSGFMTELVVFFPFCIKVLAVRRYKKKHPECTETQLVGATA